MGGQGGCEWRSEAFVKIQKKKLVCFVFGGGVGSGQGGVRLEGHGGWERRIEAFVKIKKNNNFFEGGRVGGGGGGGGGLSGWRSGWM